MGMKNVFWKWDLRKWKGGIFSKSKMKEIIKWIKKLK